MWLWWFTTDVVPSLSFQWGRLVRYLSFQIVGWVVMHGWELERDTLRSFDALPTVVGGFSKIINVVVDSAEVGILVSCVYPVTRFDRISDFENQFGGKWPTAGQECFLIVGNRLTFTDCVSLLRTDNHRIDWRIGRLSLLNRTKGRLDIAYLASIQSHGSSTMI